MFRHPMHGPLALPLLLIGLGIVVAMLGLWWWLSHKPPKKPERPPQTYAQRLEQRYRGQRQKKKETADAKDPSDRVR